MKLSSIFVQFGKNFFVLCMLVFSISVAPTISPEAQVETFRNPLNPYGGADPWLQYYEGNYYLAATTWTSTLTMRSAPTLAGLKTAEPAEIYFETDPSRCCNMWAPEFHLLAAPDGTLHWYFYYTAGTARTYNNQHTHVLESATTDPLGPYTYKGRLYDSADDVWAIDGSILKLDGSLYFLYSKWVGNDQSLFIAPMSNPWTLSGSGVLISRPEYPWEMMGLRVNEGPVVLYHGDDTFIIYSASFCATPDYKLGMLKYNHGDPLNAESWIKHPEPVFQRSDENGVYAPGHNGFFQSPDGTQDWIVYHANDSLDGGCDGRRTTRVQQFTWSADGTPNFGVPVSTETDIALPSGDTGSESVIEFTPPVISRFQAFGRGDFYMRHSNFLVRLDSNVRPFADSQFIVVPGLADPDAISIESYNFPGFYLRRINKAIIMSADDGSDTFEADSTWWVREGLADREWMSFEAYNLPGSYIGKMSNILTLVVITESSPVRAREDATFREIR
jgi:GH43 family beta-xylosidase